MGTTLTGTTPQDTYDSLIKVTNNGPLSSTARYLSDGLGNDSVLALSTTALGIGTASPTSLAQLNGTAGTTHLRVSEAGATIGFLGGANGIISGATGSMALRAEAGLILSSQGNAQTMTLTAAGNVGIGTSSPSSPLTVYRASSPDVDIQNSSALHRITGDAGSLLIRADYGNTAANTHIQFSLDGTEVGRFTPNGLTFNGDTAAANALDDYEEGTFTITATPSVSGSITLNTNTCSYTKIGRQVTVRGQLAVGSVSSPVGNLVVLGGLPFTSLNSISGRGSGSLIYFPAVGNGSLPVNYQLQNAIEWNVILDASTVAAGAELYISLTYFV